MKWFVLIIALPILLLSGALLLNRPPLLSPPGPLVRLKIYFTTNVAETRADNECPELRPRHFSEDADQMRGAVVDAMRSLGWREIQATGNEVRAVVVSPLFRFRDDVTVRIQAEGQGALLHARSASRTGKGDLAANAWHLQLLFEQVGRRLAEVDPPSMALPLPQ